MEAGRLLGQLLRGIGVDAIYGLPRAGAPVVVVPDLAVAALLAEVHPRIHGRGAAVHGDDGLLRVGPGGDVSVVDSPGGLRDAFSGRTAADARAGFTLHLAFDPDEPAPPGPAVVPPVVDRWVEPTDEIVATLTAAGAPVMLAGPGVVRAGAVPGLHAIATAAGLGVLNTWGAKGVFDWRSRHHLATVGLQQRDYELGGLGEADLIVTTGLDPDEAPPEHWSLAPAIDLDPGMLDPVAGRWSRPDAAIAFPALRTGLAAVTQEGWAQDGSPLMPTRVTRTYSAALGAGGIVAADAGTAGFWVARTYATTELGAAQVPARDQPGFAVAAALVARRRDPLRAVLAVIDGPPGPMVEAVLAAADRLGVGVPVEAWQPDGERLDAAAHHARLLDLTRAERPGIATLATDPGQLDRIIEVAGPVVAWGGLR